MAVTMLPILAIIATGSPASALPVVPLVHDYNMANLAQNERELSIAVDPNNPNRLAAGSNQRPGSQSWFTSVDGGRTWSQGVLPNGTLTIPTGPSTLMSDPSLAYGSGGQLYYSALMHDGGGANVGTLFVAESGDQGANWTDPANGVVAAGSNAPLLQDKEHIAVDRGNNDNVYVAWTPIGGGSDQQVVFSRDLGGVGDGFAFSAPITLSTQSGHNSCLNQGASLAIDGTNLYVGYVCFSSTADGAASTLWVTRSTDQGATFSAPVQAASLTNFAATSGYGAGFRTRSHPAVAADPISHRVFAVYADEIGSNTNGDIRLVQSADNGATWSSPATVNTDGGTSDQFMPWVTVGNLPGGSNRVFVSFYSRSDDATNINEHIAWSTIGASLAFTEKRVSTTGTPASTGFLGDYTFIAYGSDGVVHPAWGDGRPGIGGATDAFSARVDFSPPSAVAATGNTSLPTGAPASFTATVTGVNGENEQFIPVKFTVTGSGSPSATSVTTPTNASGQATFTFTNPTPGSNNVHIWADLNEDGIEQSGEAVDRTADWLKHATTTTLTSSANPSVFGQPVTFIATVADASGPNIGQPSGSVEFRDGVTLLGTAPLNGLSPDRATLTTASLSVATHSITATYLGDGNFLGSIGSLSQVVNKAPTITTLTANPPGSVGFGHPVTFTATVTVPPPGAGNPTGPVIFSVDGTPVQTVNLNPSEQASVTTASLSPGTHLIVAAYQGDGNFLASTGTLNYLVTCTVTVTGNHPGGIIASGDSTCVVNATVGGSITVPKGTSLAVINSAVNGSINATNQANAIEVCGSHVVGGSVNVINAQGLVIVGDPGKANCAVNTISGTLLLTNNTHGVEAIGNTVGGLVTNGNSGPGPFPGDGTVISGNIISH